MQQTLLEKVNEEAEGISRQAQYKYLPSWYWLPIFTLAVGRTIVLISEGTVTITNPNKLIFWALVFLVVTVCPLHSTSKKILKNMDQSLDELSKKTCEDISQAKKNEIEQINKNCEKCVSLKGGSALNAYNLYTYEQILMIEESVGNASGSMRRVFAYSTHRDDGEGVGIQEAEKIVQQNIEKGVEYYECFYNNPKEIKSEDKVIFKDLADCLGEETMEKCLDYRFYQHSRFGIIIYQWDDEHIEGYFCLNFPLLIKECDRSADCPVDCSPANLNRTGKIFYKKMVPSITLGLHARLCDIYNILRESVNGDNNESKKRVS